MGRVFSALLFDLDGTLVDTEAQTDQAIAEVAGRLGRPDARLPPSETRGRSWKDIVRALAAQERLVLDEAGTEAALLERWSELIGSPDPLPGVVAFLRAAASRFRLGVVSSSPRAVIDRSLEALGVSELVPPEARIGADLVTRHKPDPEGFLLAARRLGVAPEACIVFEDSTAGLAAARAAGMRSVAVLCCSAEQARCRALADGAIETYEALGAGVWDSLATRGPGVWSSGAERQT